MMKKMIKNLLIGAIFVFTSNLYAKTLTVTLYRIIPQGQGPSIGTVTFKDTHYGLLITPNFTGLPPGPHGFHVHLHASCADNGMAAGGHLDTVPPTNKHLGPYSPNGHLGDLPVLWVDSSGQANTPILAPRLKVRILKDHAIMVHLGGDNYSDEPKPLGGGGERIACGVVPK